MRKVLRALVTMGLLGSLLLGGGGASARETDNFALPLDGELADIGPFLEAAHTIALQEVVAEVNARIEKALQIKNEAERAAKLRELYDPLTLAEAFIEHFGHPLFDDVEMNRAIRGSWARRMYPGQKLSHQSMWMNIASHYPFDFRGWLMLTQALTFKVYGVYCGGDKLVHFHHLGADYFRSYVSFLKAGASPEEAYHRVIQRFTGGGFLSEQALFGVLGTGVYSNGDLAANHVGFKFYRNLTEKVVLKGEEREPLLARAGVFWRLNRHVRPRSGWFSAFVSDHWNEALNPSRYDALMRSGIRRVLQNRAEHIVQFYTQKDGRPNDPEYFNNLARELSTYYGEFYGHAGDLESLMTIGNTCMPALLKTAEKTAK